jgi:transposase
VTGQTAPVRDRASLARRSRRALIALVLEQGQALAERDRQIDALRAELAQARQQQSEQTQRTINLTANQPSSKKPEWDKDGNLLRHRPRKRRRGKRPGCGNRRKALPVDETHVIALTDCPQCGRDLRRRPGAARPGRIVEDIAPPPAKTTVSHEIEQTKWCPGCKKMVSSRTERALPGSDIGLNATIEIAWLWVMSALSLPKIQALCQSFRALSLSTAGISRMMIRLAGILQPVYEEILADVRDGARIWADETGWRVKGKLWWLWIFANERSAFYWAEACRGSPVVERILGPLFLGVLIVDAWPAYNAVSCEKQTCMAHIFRKIRAFIDAYPAYRSLLRFYVKLRRLIRDGEKLQRARPDLDQAVFQRRLKALHSRCDALLAWRNPPPVLAKVIAKVRRQRPHLLTFVEHEAVPAHNNYGEYIIKKGVLKRKVSGGSMSAEGARAYACIQSIAMTCQLRHLSFHGFLRASLVHYIRTATPLRLADYEASLPAHNDQLRQQQAA